MNNGHKPKPERKLERGDVGAIGCVDLVGPHPLSRTMQGAEHADRKPSVLRDG